MKYVGRTEKVSFPELGIETTDAKIDTGAYGNALHVDEIFIKDEKLFFKDAKKSKFGKKRSYGLRASTRCFAGEANKKKLRSYKKKSNKRKRSGEATRSKRADLRLRRISLRKKIGAK